MAPSPVSALEAEQVPVEILSARVTRVAAIPLNASCDERFDVVVTPGSPATFDLACNEVTIAIEDNRIVATRRFDGDFTVVMPEIVVAVPASGEPYIPLIVTHRPGFASRLRPVGEDGVIYADGASHPTCDCTYQFPAISGERLVFEGGRFTSRENEYLVVEARIPMASSPDGDDDGVPDAGDRCPATPPGAAVDDSGCSLDQFCEAIPVETLLDYFACWQADWRRDEPPPWPRDCRVTGDTGLACEAW